jgi:D-alanyl-D-alanine endopeptidase (penicillin-binding protein 7)
MTALVVLDARQNLNQTLTIDQNDRDNIKHTYSRVRMGTQVSRRDALHLALMSSENRMASALARHYPGSPGLHPRHEQQGQTARHAQQPLL